MSTPKKLLTPDEKAIARDLWAELVNGNFDAACEELDKAPYLVRDAVQSAIRARYEEMPDDENPFA